ncbi:MAG: hypothetical protein AAFN77_24765 [Planctomycetota bacterium]
MRRNKGTVIAASLILLTLIGGMIGTTAGLLRARSAETDAKQQAKEANDARMQTEKANEALKESIQR